MNNDRKENAELDLTSLTVYSTLLAISIKDIGCNYWNLDILEIKRGLAYIQTFKIKTVLQNQLQYWLK